MWASPRCAFRTRPPCHGTPRLTVAPPSLSSPLKCSASLWPPLCTFHGHGITVCHLWVWLFLQGTMFPGSRTRCSARQHSIPLGGWVTSSVGWTPLPLAVRTLMGSRAAATHLLCMALLRTFLLSCRDHRGRLSQLRDVCLQRHVGLETSTEGR